MSITVGIIYDNNKTFLEQAIDSIYKQTIPVEKIIVFGDVLPINNKGNLINIKNPFMMDDASIVKQLLNIIETKYFALLHSNNYYLPSKLELSINEMEEEDKIAGVYTDAKMMDKLGNETRGFNHPYDTRLLMQVNFIPLDSVFRTEPFKKIGVLDAKTIAQQYLFLHIAKPLLIQRLP